jgi:hypothetical protein
VLLANVLQAMQACGTAEFHCIFPQQVEQSIRFAPFIVFLDIHHEIIAAFLEHHAPVGLRRLQLACHITECYGRTHYTVSLKKQTVNRTMITYVPEIPLPSGIV